jgi:hypothetical protein
VAVADINGDGKPDIIVANLHFSLTVLMNTTPVGATVASFQAPQSINLGYALGPLAVGDINGDGKPDIVVFDTYTRSAMNNVLSVLLNTTPPGATTASFTPPQNFPYNYSPGSNVLADLTGDGKLDLVLGTLNSNEVPVLLNTTTPGDSVAAFGPLQNFATGNEVGGQSTSVRGVAVGDFNGDGKPDIVLPNLNANSVSVLLNTSPPSIANGTAIGTITESDPRNDVVVNGTAGNDTLTVTQTAGGGIGAITYALNGGAPVALTGVTSFTFHGLAGNDTMTVSLANGSPLAQGPGPIIFDGGTGTNTLIVDAAEQAARVVPGAVTIAGPQVVTYTNVAAININNAAAIDASAGPDTSDRATAFAGLSANDRFVQALYLDDLGRAGARSELDSWAALLNGAAGAQAAVAFDIAHSLEAQDHLVKSWYVSFLGRQAKNGEDQGWVNLLLAGMSEETVLSTMLGSAEFYDRAQTLSFSGTAEERYVQALYMLLLNRTAAAGEAAAWVGALPLLGLQQVALSFLTSTEFRTDQFAGYYEALLHRPADPTGLDGWAASNIDTAEVRIAFESSPEFFASG